MAAPPIDVPRLITHLETKWHGKACQMCGAGNWNVQQSAFELRQFHGGTLIAGGTLLPVVPIVCSNCGNTLLVNALLAGVLPTPPLPVPDTETKP